MKRILLSLLVLFTAFQVDAQIIKGSGLLYFDSIPNIAPDTLYGSEWAYGVKTERMYRWDRQDSSWLAVGGRVDTISTVADTSSLLNPAEGDIALVGTTSYDTLLVRDTSVWLAFQGGDGWGADVVNSDNTLSGDGTAGDQLKVDTSIIATKSDLDADSISIDTTGMNYAKTPILMPGLFSIDSALFDLAGRVTLGASGTANTLPIWTSSNELGDSWLSQASDRLSLAAGKGFRLIGGSTASRIAGSAGDHWYNTDDNVTEFHDGTEWWPNLKFDDGGSGNAVLVSNGNGKNTFSESLLHFSVDWDDYFYLNYASINSDNHSGFSQNVTFVGQRLYNGGYSGSRNTLVGSSIFPSVTGRQFNHDQNVFIGSDIGNNQGGSPILQNYIAIGSEIPITNADVYGGITIGTNSRLRRRSIIMGNFITANNENQIDISYYGRAPSGRSVNIGNWALPLAQSNGSSVTIGPNVGDGITSGISNSVSIGSYSSRALNGNNNTAAGAGALSVLDTLIVLTGTINSNDFTADSPHGITTTYAYARVFPVSGCVLSGLEGKPLYWTVTGTTTLEYYNIETFGGMNESGCECEVVVYRSDYDGVTALGHAANPDRDSQLVFSPYIKQAWINNYRLNTDQDTSSRDGQALRLNASTGEIELTAEQGEAYAELYITGSDQDTISATTGGTYYKVTDTQAGLSSNFTVTDSLTYTATQTRVFRVNAVASAQIDATGTNLGMRIYKNGAAETKCTVNEYYEESNRLETISCSCLLELSTNDYIDLRLASGASSSTIIVNSANLSVK